MLIVQAYESLGEKAYGKHGRYLVSACLFCQNMGAMSSYLFIIKNELPSVLQTIICSSDDDVCLSHTNPAWYFNATYILVIITLLIVAPLSSLKHIGFLGYTSGFSIACMVFFTIVIVAKYFIGIEECPLFADGIANGSMVYDSYKETIQTSSDADGLKMLFLLPAGATNLLKPDIYIEADGAERGHIASDCTYNGHLPEQYCNMKAQQCSPQYMELSDSWVYSMPTMTFSFICHAHVIPIYAELKSQSPHQMKMVAATSIASCFALYLTASLFGYLTFFNYVQSELLMTYNHSDPTNALTLTVRICLIMGVTLTLPLMHYPTRSTVLGIIRPGRPFSWPWHIGMMFVILGTCVVLVILVPDIREIFGYVGATSSSMLLFILPSLFYLKLMDGSWRSNADKKVAAIFLVFGSCFSILTLAVIISSKF